MNLRTMYLAHRLSAVDWLEEQTHPLVAAVQQRLSEHGLYKGAIHGCYDAATRDAVSEFQDLESLPPTGRMTPLTYCRLQPAVENVIAEAAAAPRAKTAIVRGNIMITKSSRTLTLFNGNNPLRQYPIAIGKPATPTPAGNYAIASKITNPGGVLGTRWMGLNYDAYGIHGTNRPWLIGQMVSNGCIRMHNHHAEELFLLVYLGCPVYIRD